jgi:hypothetical protein
MFVNLKTLSIESCEEMKLENGLPSKIEEIRFRFADLKKLPPLNNFEHLKIVFCEVCDNVHLTLPRGLQKLELLSLKKHKNIPLSEFENLKELCVCDCSEIKLNKLPKNIKKIDLRVEKNHENIVIPLGKLKNLEVLILDYCKTKFNELPSKIKEACFCEIDFKNFPSLKKLEKLRTLYVKAKCLNLTKLISDKLPKGIESISLSDLDLENFNLYEFGKGAQMLGIDYCKNVSRKQISRLREKNVVVSLFRNIYID